MSDTSSAPERQHLWDNPANVKRLLRLFFAVCALAFLIDFALARHSSFEHAATGSQAAQAEHEPAPRDEAHGAPEGHRLSPSGLDSVELFSGFYAIYGFVACVLLVLVAKVMRLVIGRDESYYGTSATYDASAMGVDPGVDPVAKEGSGHA